MMAPVIMAAVVVAAAVAAAAAAVVVMMAVVEAELGVVVVVYISHGGLASSYLFSPLRLPLKSSLYINPCQCRRESKWRTSTWR